MEETKTCSKCGKELCDDCISDMDDSTCKECAGEGMEKEDKEDCSTCASHDACCGGNK
jgi:hypothetical protein